MTPAQLSAELDQLLLATKAKAEQHFEKRPLPTVDARALDTTAQAHEGSGMSALPHTKLYAVPGPEIVFEIEAARPWIPDATYAAVCIGCDVKHLFKTLKVFIRFRIAEGPHAGVVLFRAYRVGGKIIPGAGHGSGPRPKIKRRSELFKMLSRVLRLPVNTKMYRVSYRELGGQLCTIETRTVTHDSKQQELTEPYSVVADVLSVDAGPSS